MSHHSPQWLRAFAVLADEKTHTRFEIENITKIAYPPRIVQILEEYGCEIDHGRTKLPSGVWCATYRLTSAPWEMWMALDNGITPAVQVFIRLKRLEAENRPKHIEREALPTHLPEYHPPKTNTQDQLSLTL